MELDTSYTQALQSIAQQPEAPGNGSGVVGWLQRLCRALRQVVSATGVGLTLLTNDGVRSVTAGADQASEHLEEVQFVIGEGPCGDAFAGRAPVLVPELSERVQRRWPLYAPEVLALGVQAIFSFPLQVGASRLGVLDVFRPRPGNLDQQELAQTLTFVEVAVNTLLDEQERAPPGAPAAGLEEATEQKAELFQAQGMVSIQLGVGLVAALARIRAHAYASGRRPSDVAHDIVTRQLRFDPDPPITGSGGT